MCYEELHEIQQREVNLREQKRAKTLRAARQRAATSLSLKRKRSAAAKKVVNRHANKPRSK